MGDSGVGGGSKGGALGGAGSIAPGQAGLGTGITGKNDDWHQSKGVWEEWVRVQLQPQPPALVLTSLLFLPVPSTRPTPRHDLTDPFSERLAPLSISTSTFFSQKWLLPKGMKWQHHWNGPQILKDVNLLLSPPSS